MEFIEKLVEWVKEAGKVLHLDASHAGIREKLQRHLATQHRIENPDGDYYNYPSVADSYGDGEKGQVVHAKNGKLTRSDYAISADGVKLSNHKPVSKAYVSEGEIQECEVEEIEVCESALDANGKGEICLIRPCRGSMAVYTAESLKRTAENGAFPADTQMFIDHQTEAERKAQPEGSVLKLAGKMDGKATWKEGKLGWGLYAPATVYKDFVPFINERAGDIGMSVRGRLIGTGEVQDGLPVAKEFARGLSVDFVTRAGAGGKLISVYESYRAERGGGPVPANKQKENSEMEVKEADFNALKAQADLVPKLSTRLDRLEAENMRFRVRDVVSELVRESKLPERAQTRIAKPFLSATFPVPVTAEGAFDLTKLTADVKEAIKDETTYLQESGVLRMSPVRKLGADGKEPTEPTEAELAQEADRELSDSVRSLSGLPAQERKTA